MSSKSADDLDAVRIIVEALKPFERNDQERIIRWAREKIGLASPSSASTGVSPVAAASAGQTSNTERPIDIKSFITAKAPQSDQQFAAAVAYYYRFEAPDREQKFDVTADDIQEATRKVGRDRLKSPAQTLVNAHNQGYFDKADRGRYALNTVGENLVAMALPQPAAPARRATKGQRTKGGG